MTKTITFIRHAESTGNHEGLWQGHTDTSLSETGLDQISILAAALGTQHFDEIITSDLARARQTADAIGGGTPDDRWRELALGDFEGLSTREIGERYPDVLEAMAAGDDFAIPGGESVEGFLERLDVAFEELVEALAEGSRAVVVTHGGVIRTIASRVLGVGDGFAPIQVPMNTSLTRILIDDEGRRLQVYNDATHLAESVADARWPGTNVYLFRHGQTEANLTRRWQGRGDSSLTETGRHQATLLADAFPSMDRLMVSPAGRARDTARAVAQRHGHEVQLIDDLVEMDFGEWENKTAEEAEALHPEQFDLIYRQGVDIQRGLNGESFAEAGIRLADAIAAAVEEHRGERIGMVTHGGAARAYVAHVLGMDFASRERLPVLRNTARARVLYRDHRPRLAEYNVAPHLED